MLPSPVPSPRPTLRCPRLADPTTLDGRPVAGAVAATLDRRPVAGAVAIAVAGALRDAHERALAFSDDGRAGRGADLWTGPQPTPRPTPGLAEAYPRTDGGTLRAPSRVPTSRPRPSRPIIRHPSREETHEELAEDGAAAVTTAVVVTVATSTAAAVAGATGASAGGAAAGAGGAAAAGGASGGGAGAGDVRGRRGRAPERHRPGPVRRPDRLAVGAAHVGRPRPRQFAALVAVPGEPADHPKVRKRFVEAPAERRRLEAEDAETLEENEVEAEDGVGSYLAATGRSAEELFVQTIIGGLVFAMLYLAVLTLLNDWYARRHDGEELPGHLRPPAPEIALFFVYSTGALQTSFFILALPDPTAVWKTLAVVLALVILGIGAPIMLLVLNPVEENKLCSWRARQRIVHIVSPRTPMLQQSGGHGAFFESPRRPAPGRRAAGPRAARWDALVRAARRAGVVVADERRRTRGLRARRPGGGDVAGPVAADVARPAAHARGVAGRGRREWPTRRGSWRPSRSPSTA